jgi:hypothetical protein
MLMEWVAGWPWNPQLTRVNSSATRNSPRVHKKTRDIGFALLLLTVKKGR